jgi:hypothetical protein
MRDYLYTSVDEYFPAAAQTMNATQKFGFATHPSHCGWALANGDNKCGLFGSFLGNEEYKERGRRFANAMTAFSGMWDTQPMIDSYDWATVSTFVEVGGSHGPCSLALAKAVEGTKFVVQDLEHVVEVAPKQWPRELLERVEFQTHDFLEVQPVQGADVYFFRRVFNDWPDEWAKKIMKAIVPAMRNNAKLMTYDGLMRGLGSLPEHLEILQR